MKRWNSSDWRTLQTFEGCHMKMDSNPTEATKKRVENTQEHTKHSKKKIKRRFANFFFLSLRRVQWKWKKKKKDSNTSLKPSVHETSKTC